MAFTDKDSRREQTQIARRKITFTTLVSENSKDVDVSINGEILNYVIVVPTLATDSTCDLTLTNEDSETIYANTGISETASTLVLLSATPVPMAGTVTFTVSFTTAQIATFTLYLYYK